VSLSSSYRPDIDGLRAVAVLSVVMFHAFPAALPGGFVGVDVFFVISGFLISTVISDGLDRNRFSFVDFYARRIRRIFPALIVVLITVCVAGWFMLLAVEYYQLSKHVVAGAGFISNFMFWRESGYFDTAAEAKPLLHLWSLAIEEQFYLIWPLLLWIYHRNNLNRLSLAVLIATISFILNIYAVKTDSVGAFFSPQTRFWELMAGAILSQLLLKPPARLRDFGTGLDDILRRVIYETPNTASGVVLRDMQAFTGTALLLAGVVLISGDKSFPGWWALLPVVGTVLVIRAGEGAWFNRRILSARPMVWIGLISYPLYLWHWPLLSFARIMSVEAPSWKVRTAAILAAFLLATVTYLLIERPIRRGGWIPAKAAVLSVLMVAVGYGGWYGYRESGQPFGKKMDEITLLYQVYPGDPSHDDECDTRFPQFKNFHRCRLSKPSSAPDSIIIGDSHSGHYFNTMAAVMSDRVVMNIGQQACLPFATYVSDECRINIEKTYRFIENTPSIRTVYLAGYWYHLMAGGFAKELLGGGIVRPVNANDVVQFKIFARGLITELQQASKTVVFMLDDPDLSFSPLSCLNYRPVKFLEQVRVPCAMDRHDFENRSASYDAVISNIVNLSPGLELFDPKTYLCDQQNCWAMKDGRLLYHDRHHLSAAGAALVIDGLVEWEKARR
jgi:peptidoglycan/LPS O-acetylase OafA/YrhL